MTDSYIRRQRWLFREQAETLANPKRGLDEPGAAGGTEGTTAAAQVEKEQPSAEQMMARFSMLGLAMPPTVKKE